MRGLKDKVALVTAAAGAGMGKVTAHRLAEEGAIVVVTDSHAKRTHETAEEIGKEFRGRVIGFPLDVTDRKSVHEVVNAVNSRFGRIDILVNNAALRREKPFAEMDYAEWRDILDVTLDGTFHCIKACLPALRESGAGTIINIGGLSAHSGAANRAHVVTAKAGIVGLTRALANDLSAFGMTVNCVVPGLIGTPRPKGQPEPAHHATHQTISGQRGKPEDVAAVVRFLCSSSARYITGQAIHANGGAYFSG